LAPDLFFLLEQVVVEHEHEHVVQEVSEAVQELAAVLLIFHTKT
jgi:hypothetical protein